MTENDIGFGVHQNPYQAPSAELSEPTCESMELAGRAVRLGAHILDGLVFLPLGVVGIIAVFWMMSTRKGGELWAIGILIALGLGLLVLFAIIVGINLYWLHRDGQTIGKRLCKIKIVRTDGRPASLGRIIGLRWFPMAVVQMIPFLGPVMKIVDPIFIFRESRQCLHDQIADTLVVKVNRD